MEQLCDAVFDLRDRRVSLFRSLAERARCSGNAKPSIAAPLNRQRLLLAANVDIPGPRRIRGSIDGHDRARKAGSQITPDDFDIVHQVTIMHVTLASFAFGYAQDKLSCPGVGVAGVRTVAHAFTRGVWDRVGFVSAPWRARESFLSPAQAGSQDPTNLLSPT